MELMRNGFGVSLKRMVIKIVPFDIELNNRLNVK